MVFKKKNQLANILRTPINKIHLLITNSIKLIN